MNNTITIQPSQKENRGRGHVIHASTAAAGAVALLLLGLTSTSSGQEAAGSAQFRPIEDFIEAQGTLPFIPPEQYSAGSTDPSAMRFALVDFTGLANVWIEEQSGGAISLGTETEGKIIERPLPDGRAEVTVLLRTKNALTWVAEFLPDSNPPFGQPLFGHFADEVLGGAAPALGDSLLKWVFINEAPGAPLPDLLAEVIIEPTVETIMFSLEANAKGPLREAFGVPDGTPGRAQVAQVAPMSAQDLTWSGGNWPTEHINLKVVGR